MDRLRTERHPGVWHSGGLESDGVKGTVYTVIFFIKSWTLWELFLLAKKMKFLTKGGIHCISRSSLGTFILCAGTHWSN